MCPLGAHTAVMAVTSLYSGGCVTTVVIPCVGSAWLSDSENGADLPLSSYTIGFLLPWTEDISSALSERQYP